MKAYIYRAALHCERCAGIIKSDLTAPASLDEATYDSDDYPKGPFWYGGGEADCPQHCDSCGLFLENPLTSDGVEYTREQIRRANPMHISPTIQEWVSFYGDVLCECDNTHEQNNTECLFCFYIHKYAGKV